MIGLKDDGLESLRWKLRSMSEYHLQGRSRHLKRRSFQPRGAWYDYRDQGILERYFLMRYGPIEWK